MSSTSRYTKVAVIGGGLAGHTAAATLEASGNVKVTHIYPSSPGATAMWSGAGHAFGPQTEFIPDSAGLVDAPRTPQRPVIRDRAERWEELLERREFHPYARLGLDYEQTKAHLGSAVEQLTELDLVSIPNGRSLISEHGAPILADLAARTCADAWITAGDRVAVVDSTPLVGWRAERVAHAINRTDRAEAAVVHLDAFEQPDGVDLHPVRIANQLTAAFRDDEAAFVADIADGLADAGPFGMLLLPPCVGATVKDSAEMCDALAESLGCRVAESPGARHSIHGWRADRAMRAARPPTLRVRARGIQPDGPRWSVALEGESLTVDAVILATGGWMGGGLPTRSPMREPLTGLDLWLDGAGLAHPQTTWIPDELREQPWDDHPLFRIGLAIDEHLRPLGRRGEAAYDKLFACGRVLAGYNRVWDGTTLGVDLVTGYIAAMNALEATGQSA